MFDTLIFLGQTSWRGDAQLMPNTVLIFDQRQGTWQSSPLDVPDGADEVEIRATGFSQAWLKDPRMELSLSLEISGDGLNWIGRAGGSFLGNPDAEPKPPAEQLDDPNMSVQLETGPTRPRQIRGVSSSRSLQSYAMTITFKAAGIPL